MAIPLNTLSIPDIPAPFLPPRNVDTDALVSLHRGGFDVENVSRGLNYQDWRASMDGDDVMLIGLTSGDEYTLLTLAGIEELELAFDQLMHPYIAVRLNSGVCQMWWFNPISGATEFYTLPSGASHPRIVLDDVRDSQTSASDVLVFYIYANALYMRRQRDRWTVEYLMRDNVASLSRVGMGTNLRLQFLT